MNVSAFLKELILHACTFAKLNKKAANERRIVEILVFLQHGTLHGDAVSGEKALNLTVFVDQ